MKSKILAIVLCLAMLASLFGLYGCTPLLQKLDVPVLTLNGEVAVWQPIEGAVHYDIDINGNIYRIAPTVTRKALKVGDTIKVRAVANDTARDSDWSLPIKYSGTGGAITPEKLLTPIVSISDEGVASWDAIEGAVKYVYSINGEAEEHEADNTLSVRLSDGDMINVRAIGDGTHYLHSDWSQGKEYTKPAPPPLPTLPIPTVTVDEDGIASWISVFGAIEYAYKINNGDIAYTTNLDRRLDDGDTIIVKAIGDGVAFSDSAWSVAVTYTAPSDTPVPTALAAPIVTISEDGVATWAVVTGATGYKYKVNNGAVNVASGLSLKLADGDTILVMAVGDGITYTDSAWSTAKTYNAPTITPDPIKLSTPTITISDDGVASWAGVTGASGYKYQINGGTVTRTSSLSRQLSSGDTIRVMAVGDGVTYADSDWSAVKTYTYTDPSHTHTDKDDDGSCDNCYESVIVLVDFYAVNDLHGKFCDTATQPGVDELSTYFKSKETTDDNVVVLSSGDMWQGAAESNLTYGAIITDWMNEVGFVSMTLGNHEYDWGADYIKQNLAIANFPFLAINIYDTSTGKLVDYCTPSVLIEEGGIQIGIIGAIGDCYSSIHSDMSEGIEFKTGSALTSLVKAEANRLRAEGADLIVYSLHDGTSGYDTSLSNGYVDLVFEGHTHSAYCKTDTYGVYHLQNGGENYGISHAEVGVNTVTGTVSVTDAKVVQNSEYKNLADDPATEALEVKYAKEIDMAYTVIGENGSFLNDSEVEDIVAKLYYEAGVEKWGSKYDIVLGGGFLKLRAPYQLHAGNITMANLISILPFDNQLVLCSVKGSDLLSKFINTSNSDYHIYLKDGMTANDISYSDTYYIIVDTYTSTYKYNNLTEIERYDDETFARDLFSDYIKSGALYKDHSKRTLTSISDILSIGGALSSGEQTEEIYYVEGTVSSISDGTYGNMYIKDSFGNSLYIYNSYDYDGNRYDTAPIKPTVGDKVVLFGTIKNYNGRIEMMNGVWLSIE